MDKDNTLADWIHRDQRHCATYLGQLFANAPSQHADHQPSEHCSEVVRLIPNVHTKTALLRAGDSVLPVTINDVQHDNSWVCSPYTAAISYAGEETRHLRSSTAR
ncbi:MAG: hypothetical protein AAFP69_19075, partial [Planctomycetota bacterium]